MSFSRFFTDFTDVVLTSTMSLDEHVYTQFALGPSLRGFFGKETSRSRKSLTHGTHGDIEGWLLEWHYEKEDSCGAEEPFRYGITCFVPHGVRVSRALELIFDKFRVFLEHELREGFLLGTWKPFPAHPGPRQT